MEEGVHEIGVRYLVRGLEDGLEELPDLGQSPLGHRFDVGPTHVDATGQTEMRNKTVGLDGRSIGRFLNSPESGLDNGWVITGLE